MSLRSAIPIIAGGVVALQAIFSLTKQTNSLIRPPGAGTEDEFCARCIKCGRCIEACPYVALNPARNDQGFAVGTPYLNVEEQACRLCEDFPCVEACPTNALAGIEKRSDVAMGLAVIDEELCIAFKGMRCEVCYRVCPLIDEAITIDHRPREGDVTHAIFAPVIDEELCVGCGLCVERCVVRSPQVAIAIVRE